MKKFIICAILLSSALSVVIGTSFEEAKAKLEGVYKECMTEAKVTEEQMAKMEKGEIQPDHNAKCGFACFLKKIGLLDDKGDISEKNMKEYFSSVPGLDECSKVKKDGDVCEFANNIMTCFEKYKM